MSTINLFSDAPGLIDTIRENGRRGFGKGNLAKVKAQNYARLAAKGKAGFKPLNLQTPGLSSKARSQIRNLQSATTGFLASLIDLNFFQQEGQTTLIFQNQINELTASIEENSGALSDLPSGSLVDETA